MGTTSQPLQPLPAAAELLTLERLARRQGSGINSDAVLGQWRLQTVWPRKDGQPSAVASGLLRGLGASLTIVSLESELGLCNAVSLGLLTLQFIGRGELAGPRPLLRFSFNEVQLCWGQQKLWSRPLPKPPSQRMPFFALIARGPSGWLAARGRGGGLALWCLAP